MLREVWLNISLEKIDTHEGIMVKALLDSSIMGMFMDKRMAAKHRFRLQKLERPIAIRNVDRTNNSGGAITHQVECNVFYKGYIKRMQMDVYNLEKTEVILGIVTNFIWSYLHQFFDDSHGLRTSLKPSRRPFDRYQSRLEAINDGQDIRQINW